MATKKKKTKDFIEKELQLILYITPEQMKIVEKYRIIIKALREKYMTVKEIHDLYYDTETKKHRYTIKTIYRHLEILEEQNLVTAIGHRVTEGSRVLEKLYARTGTIFYLEMDEEYQKYKQKYYDKLLDSLHVVISELYNKPDLDLQKFKEIFLPYFSSIHAEVEKLMKQIPGNPRLTDLYSKIDINSVNALNQNAVMIKVLLSKPEILEKLRKVLDTK